jgi:Tfp pilus assembly protein PilN
MKTRLNFATSPLLNRRKFVAGAGAAGIVGLLAFLILSVTAFRTWRSNREITAETDALRQHIRQLVARQQELRIFFEQPAEKQQMDRAAFLNSLILERSFPWVRLFEDLEKDLPPGVRVVNIAPRLEKGRVQVKIVIGADSDENKIKFLQALENSKSFSEVEVKQETHPKQTAGESDRVLLELEAWYQAA